MPPSSAMPAIDPRILDEAAEWLMQLHGGATDAQRQACAQWQRLSPEHGRAWARAERLIGTLGGLPPALASQTLARSRTGRRMAVAKIAAMLAVVPAGVVAWRLSASGAWRAEHHTPTGERREVQLADGSRISMNTASAMDVQFDATQRLVLLRAGEILVQTAPDPAAVHRPFRVRTSAGTMEALGTRFNVRQSDEGTRLAVLQGAVRVQPANAGAQTVVQAGEAMSFTEGALGEPSPGDAAETAWTQGMLLAFKMPLARFAAELSRYRPGILHCDPAVAGLLVTGAYPVDAPDRALAMLVGTYAVDARTRLGGYWVTLVPRS